MSPVSESLFASLCETSKARSIASRSDALLPTTSTSRRTSSVGGDPSDAVTWKTPTELPPMLTGMQTAEQLRPRRFGHASMALLVGNTIVWPWAAAGQSSGDTTPHRPRRWRPN